MAGGYVADRKLYLNADRSEVVEENDPAAAYLYATPGQVVEPAEAEKYGLHGARKADVKAGADKEEAEAPDVKQQREPAESKARKAAPEDKSR